MGLQRRWRKMLRKASAGICLFQLAGCGRFLVGATDGFGLLAGFGLAAAFFVVDFAGDGLVAGPAVVGSGGGFFRIGHVDWDAGFERRCDEC